MIIIINIIFIFIILGVFATAYVLYNKSKMSTPVRTTEKKNTEDIEFIEKENLNEQKLTKEEIIKKYGITPETTITEKELDGEFEEVHD